MKTFIYYYSVSVVALILFLQGFFPIQQNPVASQIEAPTSLKDFKFNTNEIYQQEIDRLVLIVIDALRHDFITKNNTPFLSSVDKRLGCTLTIKVESPTVTLPRIKAITTGSVPQFVDVILNLASSEALTDSFLHQAVAVQKKVIFYGDDTWIKLFPKIFERFEGVSSFFVNDFIEVDNNVTRNVQNELIKEDWDIMILHYLGLDHIGHVFGPYSQFVPSKLQEMDEVVRNIYLASKTWNKKTAILVTGDHGMKDTGGHGGSTYNEIHVPLVTIGLPCKSGNASQSDIASTLTILMGLKLMTNNVGYVIYDLLHYLPYDRLLYALYYNSLLLHSWTQEFDAILENASSVHYNFCKTNNQDDAILAHALYQKYLENVSHKLIQTSIKQDNHQLFVSGFLLMYCFCTISYNLLISKYNHKFNKLECAFSSIIIILFYLSPKVLILTLIYVLLITISIIHKIIAIIKISIKWKPKYNIKIFLIFFNILSLFSLLSSSYIEEEHQIWYFFWGTFIILSYFEKYNSGKLLLLFIGVRLLKTLNKTGNKWAHLPDLAQWLILEENYIYLQILVCASLFLLPLCYILLNIKERSSLFVSVIILILIYIFRIWIPKPTLAKLIWFLICLNAFIGLLQNNRSIDQYIVSWTLVCALIMRPHNIILLSSCIFSSIIISNYINHIVTLSVLHLWLGKTFFFLQGHSNSLASIDIACGYVGLQDYIPMLVIMQVISHTFAFPILSNLLMLKNHYSHATIIWKVNGVCKLATIIVTCIVTFIQRQHLFVWSVFAPKLLIESCNLTILLIEIFLFYGVIFLKNNLFNL